MFQISQKQNQVAQAVKSRQKKIILLAGSLGTSKTFGAAAILISLAIQYPGSVIGVGRKNTTEMRRGTMMSFDEAAKKMNIASYHENRQEMTWTFENGSKIMFFEVDRSHDRDFSKIKSMNLTCAFIDEVDAIQKEGFLAVYGRVGRANENGAPDFILMACNPNESWVKEDYYEKFKDDTLLPDVAFIEFEITDSFLNEAYFTKFESSPNNWKQRYLYNNWSYGDDDMSLFKYKYLDRAHVNVLKDGIRYSALDVARFGTDRSVAATWQGKQLIDITIIKDKEQKLTLTAQGRMYMDYCANNQVGYEHATVDAVGNGGGVVDWLHEHHFYVKEFIAGGKAKGNYNNKRSEATHMMAQAFEKGEAKFLDSCPYLSELKKELTMQNYDTLDKVLRIESKDKIRDRLGMSPDIADAVMMAYSLQVNTGMLTLADISL